MDISNTLPWPGWEIVRRLGGGSYGSVYEIRRERLGIEERAALKIITIPSDPDEVDERRRSGFTDASLMQSYEQQAQHFLDEYMLMTKLQGQSCIVDCKDYEPIRHPDGIGWDIYIKMELLTPLKKYLSKDITPDQAVDLGVDMCNALVLCREKGIIHRDIKPDNILVTDGGRFKLGDFGIAKMADKTMAGTRTGTPGFIAPEVFHNEPYGKSVDIYSLGMVLYWMLNYRTLPFLPLPPQMPTPDEEQTALQRRMRGEPLPPPAKGGPALQSIVLKACAYRPEDRYATPEEFLRALKAVRAADTSTVDTIPDAQPVAPAAEPSFPDAGATMGNNWETTGGRDDIYYTETNNTDPTMETMGTEGGAATSSEAKQQDAACGKDVYTQVRITPQEAAAGCKVETRDAADRYVRVAIPQGIENGAIIRVNGHGAAGVGGGAPGDLLVRIYVQNAPAEKSAPANTAYAPGAGSGAVPSASAKTPSRSSGKSKEEIMQRYACIAPENRKMYILQDALVAFLGLMLVVYMLYVYYWDYDLQRSLEDFGDALISVLNLPLLEIFDILLFGHDVELYAIAGVLAVILYMLIIAAAVFAIVDLRRHLAARKYIAQHGAVEAPSVQQQYLWRFNRYEEKRLRMKKDGLLPYVIVFALLLYFNISLAIIGYRYVDYYSYFDIDCFTILDYTILDYFDFMFGLRILLLDALFVVCVLRRRVRKNACEAYHRLQMHGTAS